MKSIEDRVTDTHVYFWGDPTLSNWGPAKFEHKSETFQNSEQAFMWEKAIFFGDEEIASDILSTDNPSLVKKLGRKVKNFDNTQWEEERYDAMLSVCLSKFSQNEEQREILLNTEDRTIVEGSPYDKVWGVGLHWASEAILNESKWDGLNLLGEVLMDVRTKLKE